MSQKSGCWRKPCPGEFGRGCRSNGKIEWTGDYADAPELCPKCIASAKRKAADAERALSILPVNSPYTTAVSFGPGRKVEANILPPATTLPAAAAVDDGDDGGNGLDWQEAIEQIDELMALLDDLPERAEDYSSSVSMGASQMRDWIEANERVTAEQWRAIENWTAGAERWLRR